MERKTIKLLVLIMIVLLILLLVNTTFANMQNRAKMSEINQRMDNIAKDIEDDVYPPLEKYSLISYWSFDNNSTKDNWGKNDGTNHGAVYTPKGKFGGAFEFDGNKSYIDYGKDKSLDITNEITISMWVKFNKFNENELILTNGLYQFYHRGNWTGNTIYFMYRVNIPEGAKDKSPCDSSWDGLAGIKTKTELKTDKWHNLIGVKSGDMINIYLDGVTNKELNNCFANGFTVDNSKRNNLGAGSYFSGVMDEVKIWNRALSPKEIENIATKK